LVEFGGNDCDFNWDIVAENPTNKDIKPSVSLEQFKVNTQTIIDKLRKLGKRIAIMSLPPIDANKYFKWISKGDKQRAANILQFLGDVNFIYRHQELYAVAFKQIAIDNNIPVVPVRETLLGIHKLSDYICEDGIHLNEQGQAVVESVFENTYLQYHPETK
jgi:lysophospholipase L1-like esterase